MAEIYALIGFSVLYQKDKLNTYILTDSVDYYMKHKNTPVIVEDAVERIMSLKLKKKTLDLSILPQVLLKHKRSYVILIGDFCYPVDLLHISRKHRIAIIKVRDREEENPEKYEKYQLKSFDGKRRIPF